jgi:hypothetical protein
VLASSRSQLCFQLALGLSNMTISIFTFAIAHSCMSNVDMRPGNCLLWRPMPKMAAPAAVAILGLVGVTGGALDACAQATPRK